MCHYSSLGFVCNGHSSLHLHAGAAGARFDSTWINVGIKILPVTRFGEVNEYTGQ